MFDWYVVNKPLILYETGQFKQQNVPFRKKNISLTNYSSVQATECILKKNNSQLSACNRYATSWFNLIETSWPHTMVTMQFLHKNLNVYVHTEIW